MKKYFISILVLFMNIHSFGQNGNFEFKGTIEDDSTGLGLSEVNVSLFNKTQGLLIESVTTASNGKYKLKSVTADENYIVKISKLGYISKFFLIIGENVPEDNTADFPVEMSSSLFKGNSDDYYLLEHVPVAIGRYSKSVDNIEWDINYIKSIKKMTAKNKK